MIKESLSRTKRIGASDCSGLIGNPWSKPRERIQLNQSPLRDEGTTEVLKEGQECPFCHFAKLKREGNEISCPVCGYGRRICT